MRVRARGRCDACSHRLTEIGIGADGDGISAGRPSVHGTRANRLVVGLDGTERSRDALALGHVLCEALGARLLMAYVHPYGQVANLLGHESPVRELVDSIFSDSQAILPRGTAREMRILVQRSPSRRTATPPGSAAWNTWAARLTDGPRGSSPPTPVGQPCRRGRPADSRALCGTDDDRCRVLLMREAVKPDHRWRSRAADWSATCAPLLHRAWGTPGVGSAPSLAAWVRSRSMLPDGGERDVERLLMPGGGACAPPRLGRRQASGGGRRRVREVGATLGRRPDASTSRRT
jgi:hypothetical protein